MQASRIAIFTEKIFFLSSESKIQMQFSPWQPYFQNFTYSLLFKQDHQLSKLIYNFRVTNFKGVKRKKNYKNDFL